MIQLPEFISQALTNHTTSLGRHACFPSLDYDAQLIIPRFEEVTRKAEQLEDVDISDIDSISHSLTEAIQECIELEKPIRQQLETICENSVIKLFDVPVKTINLTCKIVDKIEPEHNYRLTPEEINPTGVYTYIDVADKVQDNPFVAKQRLINCLIQGVAHKYATNPQTFYQEVGKINKDLPKLYYKIRVLNDYLLFAKEYEISDNEPKQGAYVEVTLGFNGNRTTIHSQGLILPFLFQETLRGFFELFASHGLPEDNALAMAIIKNADFIVAEPWDARLGVNLWRLFSRQIPRTEILPYLFTDICKLDIQDFFVFMKEMMAHKPEGIAKLNNMITDINQDLEYDKFVDTLKKKQTKYTILSDDVDSVDNIE